MGGASIVDDEIGRVSNIKQVSSPFRGSSFIIINALAIAIIVNSHFFFDKVKDL